MAAQAVMVQLMRSTVTSSRRSIRCPVGVAADTDRRTHYLTVYHTDSHDMSERNEFKLFEFNVRACTNLHVVPLYPVSCEVLQSETRAGWSEEVGVGRVAITETCAPSSVLNADLHSYVTRQQQVFMKNQLDLWKRCKSVR